MDLKLELESKSAPRIKKAAIKIAKQNLNGYEDQLIDALKLMIQKPKSWQAQSQLIKTIGITHCKKALPYLKELVLLDFKSTVLYRDLGFSICLLGDIKNNSLNFLKSILASNNLLLISGACSAVLYSKHVPTNDDISIILESISEVDCEEGQVITPRCYIAAVAYLWPETITKEFLELCMKSKWNTLVDIAESSLKGRETNYVLV